MSKEPWNPIWRLLLSVPLALLFLWTAIRRLSLKHLAWALWVPLAAVFTNTKLTLTFGNKEWVG